MLTLREEQYWTAEHHLLGKHLEEPTKSKSQQNKRQFKLSD